MEFGNRMAKSGLWREAYFRWQKHLLNGHNTAAVHNNMAIALENMGRFKEAEQNYLKAMELAPGNQVIKENYDQFKRLQKKGKNEK
jgi:Flp pilus assembly protein TadD